MTATDVINHICFDDRGVAWIDGTRIKVIEVATDWVAHRWSAEKVHYEHPHLSLAQIHAAMAFYFDHQEEFDQAIQESAVKAKRLAEECSATSPIQKRLRKMNLLR